MTSPVRAPAPARARPLAELLGVALMGGLGGCAGALEGYPSLAPRAAEGVSIAAPIPDASTPSPAAPPALAARLSALRGEAAAAGRDFTPLALAAERAAAAARGGPRDGEAWLVAQQAISRAESAIVPTAAALAELDRLVADLRLTAATEPSTDGLAEALAARAAVEARHEAQVRRVEALRTGLR